MIEQMRRLIFGDTRIRPVLPEDVEAAKLPAHLEAQAQDSDRLSIRLMLEAHDTAAISARIREALAQDVAIRVQRRGI